MKMNGWMLKFLTAMALFSFSCASGQQTVAKPVEKSRVKSYLTKITPIEKKGTLELTIEGSGKIQYTIFKLDNPRRLIVDMPDVDSSAFSAPIELSKGVAWKITPRYFPKTENSRIEIFLNETAMYTVTRLADNRITVSMKPFVSAGIMGPDRDIGPGETEITSIDLRDSAGLARIEISYRGPTPKYDMIRKRKINRITLDLGNSKIRKKNERLLSVQRKDTIIKDVAVFQFITKPKGVVKVIANLNEFTSSSVYEEDNKIIFDIGSDAILAEASQVKEEQPRELRTDKEKEAGIELPEYTGNKISLDFQSAGIHNILRILADVSGMNIITSDSVSGKVTIKLKNVPWDQALDIILKNNQLGMIKEGNIIRVATRSEISAEKKAEASEVKIEKEVEPLFLKVFQINYESSAKLKSNLEGIKSSRGSIDVNERSNTLIIQDTKGRLAEMERLIEILDKRAVQILIEARIVEVSHSSARELGIRWGGRLDRHTGASFPATIGLSGIGSGGAVSSSAAGSVVDLGISAATGALGIRLGSIDNTAFLDMQLMAMQNKGKGKIVSTPKITTMNNVEALIETGRQIPYTTTSADGTKTEFKDATLALRVTPHVSPDGYIRLEIDAKKDEADFANQLPNSPPPLITKHARTEVMIKDGHTTVIGGLFKENISESQASVPLLSRIPFFGWLFKNKSNTNEGEELLIFITPKIL